MTDTENLTATSQPPELNATGQRTDTVSAPRTTTGGKASSGPTNHVDDDYPVYLPPDILGGSLPYVPGMEEEAVWNAASQACATDRVHYVYTVDGDRIWFLATPSSSIASNPDSWCPLAAALPGNSEFWDKETVYIYDQEGTTAALRWDPDTGRMQVYVGPSRIILPRLQTMEANFVTINPKQARPVFWRNKALREEQLSRMTIRALFWSGAAVTAFAIGCFLIGHMIGIMVSPGLITQQAETRHATDRLMNESRKAVRNEADRYVYRLQDLLWTLQNLNGTLLRYEVKEGGNIEWEALIPPAANIEGVRGLQAVPTGTAPDGRLKIKGTY